MEITCKNGKTWRVDGVIRGKEARRVQFAPGWGQINVSPPDAETRCHYGISIREWMIDDVLAGRIKIRVA